MPKLPTSRATIDLQGEYAKTIDGLPFKISSAESQGECIVYASPHGLKLMSSCKIWGGDGTYFSCPKLFSQLYTIQGSILLDFEIF